MRDALSGTFEGKTSTPTRLFATPATHDTIGEPTINPHFVITRDGYHLRLTHTADSYRHQIRQLIERMYAWRGLHTQHPEFSARSGQTTLVACAGDHLFGTCTLGLDKNGGLLADTLYRKELNAMRDSGRRVCEVTRLAIDPAFGSHEVMATIFHLVFILARRIHDMTDLFMEVNPRHVGFYRRMLSCRVAGPELTCPRVGAPAVLMHLPLDHAGELIRKFGGRAGETTRTLYRQFFSKEEEAHLLGRLLDVQAAA